MKHICLVLLFSFGFLGFAFAQTDWYVGIDGQDTNGFGASPQSPFATINYATDYLNPGDTLFVLGGNYYNKNYGSGNVWNTENTVKINHLHGEPGAFITFKPFDGQDVIFKGDGGNIFRMSNCSYLRIEGFEMYGEVENISLETALAYQFMYKDVNGNIHYRVEPGTPPEVVDTMTFPVLTNIKRPAYTNTRGFYASDCHHLDILNNLVHHAPGTGFRVARGDYINAIGNEVHNCSRKSYSGTHAFVFHSSTSYDNSEASKILIARNHVHNNYNEIYSWAPSKTFITPLIDEGKGISMQSNDPIDGWTHGRIQIENNLTYHNGFSGIHVNGGSRMDIVNNTVFDNFASGRGNNTGISLQSGSDIQIINNIAVSNNDWGGHAISAGNSSGLTVSHNLVSGLIDQDINAVDEQTTFQDPLFKDPEDFDFSLQANSPAIGMALVAMAPQADFLGHIRDAQPDVGAFEYPLGNSLDTAEENSQLVIFPNPGRQFFIVRGVPPGSPIRIFDVLGKDLTWKTSPLKLGAGEWQLDCSALGVGMYFVSISGYGASAVFKE